MIVNNTIDSCRSWDDTGGGISFWACSYDTAYSNIITNCLGGAVFHWQAKNCFAAYNDCYRNLPDNYAGMTPGPGSISVSPLYADPTKADYRLRPTSPCIDAGHPDPVYNDPDGTRNNMGAFSEIVLNHVPSQFALLDPTDGFDIPLTQLVPEFSWTPASDEDVLDTVLYDLYVARDQNFSYVRRVSDLMVSSYTSGDSLSWGARYWWKVCANDRNGGATWSSQTFHFRTMTPGDASNDEVVNVVDVVYLVNYIFAGGLPPVPGSAGDANCDGKINIADCVFLISYIFSNGPAPCAVIG